MPLFHPGRPAPDWLAKPPSRVLVFIPNWLGDAVMCTPALRALKRRFPEVAVTVTGKASCCAVLAGLPWIDTLVPMPERAGFAQSLSFRRSWREQCPDLALVFPHSFRAAWQARLSGALHRVGVDRGGRRLLLSHSIPRNMRDGRPMPRYSALEYLDLVAELGAEDDGAGLELAADSALTAEIRGSFSPGTPLVGIAPGAAFGPSKRWLPERFAAVADRLARDCGARCVLLTGPGEEDTRDAVLRAATVPLHDGNGGSPSIDRLKSTIAALDLLIGNDSGPRHIAIAFRKPVVCIMGSTNPAYTDSPWERGEVIRVDVDCGPCQRPHCTTDHRCMTGIPVNRVVDAARRCLGC